MFRRREQSERASLESLGLSPYQRRRLVNSWPVAFRQHILPLLREEDFAHFYHQSHGAPNRCVQIVLGILLLKEMFSLGDEEALDHAAFDLRWQVALDVVGQGVSCRQKTLHNFRVRLRQRQASVKLFNDIASRLKDLLRLDTSRQRLDSTHIRSNTAILTRLGLFCESLRLFLRRLRKDLPEVFSMVPEELRRRYLDDQGDGGRFDHADRDTGRRRLPVVCRDLQRLLDIFGDLEDLRPWPELATCRRLFFEQCRSTEQPIRPEPTEADAALGPVSVEPRPPKEIAASSLQTPHDADVTYGNKGQGYEVQIAETFGNKTQEEPDKPELITFVDVTPSCGADIHTTIKAVLDLKERGLQPEQLETDGNYTSSAVVQEARRLGTDVNGPVQGNKELPGPADVTVGDFKVDLQDGQKSRCPAGRGLHSQAVLPPGEKALAEKQQAAQEEKTNRRISLTMLQAVCAACAMEAACPMQEKKQSTQERENNQEKRREVRTSTEEILAQQRRRYQTTAEYKARHRNRAGIEATNSEGKRAHGLGKLSVRGQERVKQAVCLKLAACNIKRVVHYLSRLAKRRQ
jgi:hypothetical protein